MLAKEKEGKPTEHNCCWKSWVLLWEMEIRGFKKQRPMIRPKAKWDYTLPFQGTLPGLSYHCAGMMYSAHLWKRIEEAIFSIPLPPQVFSPNIWNSNYSYLVNCTGKTILQHARSGGSSILMSNLKPSFHVSQKAEKGDTWRKSDRASPVFCSCKSTFVAMRDSSLQVTSPESHTYVLNPHSCWKEFDGLKTKKDSLNCQCSQHRQGTGILGVVGAGQVGKGLDPPESSILTILSKGKDGQLKSLYLAGSWIQFRPLSFRQRFHDVLCFVVLRDNCKLYHHSLWSGSVGQNESTLIYICTHSCGKLQ